MFKHDNIAELYDYTENEDSLTMYMEYVNDAKYFENLILFHHKEIRDEHLLRDFTR